jgi:hypothetical protein
MPALEDIIGAVNLQRPQRPPERCQCPTGVFRAMERLAAQLIEGFALFLSLLYELFVPRLAARSRAASE